MFGYDDVALTTDQIIVNQLYCVFRVDDYSSCRLQVTTFQVGWVAPLSLPLSVSAELWVLKCNTYYTRYHCFRLLFGNS